MGFIIYINVLKTGCIADFDVEVMLFLTKHGKYIRKGSNIANPVAACLEPQKCTKIIKFGYAVLIAGSMRERVYNTHYISYQIRDFVI